MTEKQRRAWIVAALRRASVKWPARTEAKRAARVSRGRYLCAACGEIHPAKCIQMDHRAPVGRFTDFNSFIDRLFCPSSNYQALCLDCHKAKTAAERAG